MKLIDEIYEDKVIIEQNGAFICPVCRKEYKRKPSAVAHLEKQDCHSTYDVFGNTAYEEKALMFYKNVSAMTNARARPTMKSFRKNSLYKNTVTFVVSCMMNDVDAGLMYGFLNEVVGFSFPNKIMKEGQDMKWVMEYRSFIHNHPEISDSKEFFDQYKDVLKEDDDFLISSIEKAKLSFGYAENVPSLVRRIENFPAGYKMRLLDVLDRAERSKW